MAKVLIIGAGGVGNVVTHKCAQIQSVFSEILLASRTKEKCDAIAASVDHPNLSTAQVNADQSSEVAALIKDFQPDIVINVALPYQDLPIMDACLEMGVNYLDTANYEPPDEAKFEYKWQWAYHERYKQAGLTAILGCGFDPGVTGIFTAYALKHYFDEIHYLDIVDCNAGSHGQALRPTLIPRSTFEKSLRMVATTNMATGLKWNPLPFTDPLTTPKLGLGNPTCSTTKS